MNKKIYNQEYTLNSIKNIKNIFEKESIEISKSSYLGKLLNDVEKEYLQNKKVSIPYIFQSIHINRINTAINSITNISNNKIKHYLHDLKKGSLDFFSSDPSHAKNILFELEVASIFNNTDGEIIFAEPDLVFKFYGNNIAIACKKIVSENNLKKNISKGAKQIKKQELDFGIIAINIDNILPNNSILEATNAHEAYNILNKHVDKFIDKHRRHLNRKIGVDNIIGILIIASVITDLNDEKPQFNKLQSSNFYTKSIITQSTPIFKKIADSINTELPYRYH